MLGYSVAIITVFSFAVFAVTEANAEANSNNKEAAQGYLAVGSKLLATGQLNDALSQFHSAIEADPTNYQAYFRRGTVYLAMGKFKSALGDLDSVVERKPDFVAARLQRGNVFAKQGLFKAAVDDYNQIVKEDPKNGEARERIQKINSIVEDISGARNLMDQAQDYAAAAEVFTKVLEHSPWSTEIHEWRSDCYLRLGKVSEAIMDIHVLAKLIPDNTDAFYRLSELHYSVGSEEQALNNIRECLRLDGDNKKCMKFYKKLRKLSKLIKQMVDASNNESTYNDCVEVAKKVQTHDPESAYFVQKGRSFICQCHSKANNNKEAIEACGEVLKHNVNDADAHFYRAEAYADNEQLEKAQADCNRAHEIEQSQRTEECKQRIARMIKQSKKRDYYKILGVRRSADKAKILKAYRKLAKEWHPDNFSEGEAKDNAQKKFIDIAAAKEVLTDPKKRQKFDHGEDPLDAEEQANNNRGGFNPFGGGHQGFNPFGDEDHHGGGHQQHFKFKFN